MAFLAVEWIVFLLLGIYIDLVFPQQGYRKHPLFFLGFPWFERNSRVFKWSKLRDWISSCWSRVERVSSEATESPITSFDSLVSGDSILASIYNRNSEVASTIRSKAVFQRRCST